ncbi:MAG: hypothetical protein U0992_22275 [Planctomycetaceae bacterium]
MLTARDGANTGRALGMVAAIAFALPLCLLTIGNLRIQDDDAQRLAATDPHRRLAEWQRRELPQSESLLVTWAGSTIDDPRIAQLSTALIGHVDPDGVRRGGAAEIAQVITPEYRLQQMIAGGVERDEAVQRLTGVVMGAGGLKLKLTDAGAESIAATTERLIRAARANLGIELEVSGPIEAWSAATSDNGAAAIEPVAIPEHDLQVTWSGFHPQSTVTAQVRSLILELTDFPTANEPDGRKLFGECFVAQGAPVGIEVALSEAGAADVPAAVRAIERAATAAEISEIHIVGEPLTRAEQARTIDRILWTNDAVSRKLHDRSLPLLLGAVLLVLTCVVVRGLRVGVAISVVSIAAAVLSAASLRLAGTAVDPILLALPILTGLLLLAGGLQIADRRLESDDDRSSGAIHTQATTTVFRTAMILVALSLMPLMISSTPPVRHFGLIGVISVSIALLLGLVVLPLLLPAIGSASAARRNDAGFWRGLSQLVTRRSGLTTALCLLMLLAGAGGAAKLRIDGQHVRTLPPATRLAKDTRFVEDNLTGASPVDVVVRFTAASLERVRFLERVEIVRAAERAAKEHPAVIGTLSLADMLPVTELPPADASTRVRSNFARQSNQVEERVRSEATFTAETLLFKADRATDWQLPGDARLSGAGDELWRISANVLLPPGVAVEHVTAQIDASIQQVLRRHPDADHVVAAPAVLADGTRQALLRSLGKTTGLACVMLIGALIWLLRTPTAILVSLLTQLLPMGCVLGLAAMRGMQFDVGGLLAIVVALAISTQSAAQLLIWFRGGVLDGDGHADAARQALIECGAGLWRLTLVAIGVALALRTCEVEAVGRFGGLLAGLIGATQLTTLVLLPALLAGRIGRWLQRALCPRPIVKVHEAAPSPHVKFEPALRDVVRPAV